MSLAEIIVYALLGKLRKQMIGSLSVCNCLENEGFTSMSGVTVKASLMASRSADFREECSVSASFNMAIKGFKPYIMRVRVLRLFTHGKVQYSQPSSRDTR